MSNDPKGDQAIALIAALQSILDNLPESTDDAGAEGGDEAAAPINDPTHELFVGGLDQSSLAGLFTSIRIIHNIHNKEK